MTRQMKCAKNYKSIRRLFQNEQKRLPVWVTFTDRRARPIRTMHIWQTAQEYHQHQFFGVIDILATKTETTFDQDT